MDAAKEFAAYVVAAAGAWIGWALGASIASGMVAPVDSFWARASLAGVLLQFGGAAVGAVTAFLIARAVLKN
jgi:hypothetical protein